MRVDDYLSAIVVPGFSYGSVYHLIELRQETFRGFASIEERKGLVKHSVSFNTSQGQEVLRILLFRVLEEVTESSNSSAKLHIQEELIDAANYLLSALMVDHTLFPPEKMTTMLYDVINSHGKIFGWYGGDAAGFTPPIIQEFSLGNLTKLITGDLAETFRNRSWMNNTQQTYFQGYDQATDVFDRFMHFVLCRFANWGDFYRLYVAKDMVLQFRLKSNY